MGLYIKPPAMRLPQDITQIAGRFGALPGGFLETVTGFNTARIGFMRAIRAVSGAPDASWPWGILWTVSSSGAGTDGLRNLTDPLSADEVAVQLFWSTSGALYSRAGFGSAGFTPWKKPW